MTYSMMGLGASQQGGCTGGVYGFSEDICCSVDTWNNRTYGGIKGAASRRYLDEKRVRHALDLLINKGALDDFAYQKGDLPFLPGFRAQLQLAADNYLREYPAGRWKKQEVGVFHKCGPGGHYSIWVDPSPPTGTDKAMIESVPMSADLAKVGWLPDVQALLTTQNGQVAPGGWLKNFIGHFGTLRLPDLTPEKPTPIRQPTTPPLDPGRSPGTSGGGGGALSTGAKVALGVGVVGVAGGLWWATRRR